MATDAYPSLHKAITPGPSRGMFDAVVLATTPLCAEHYRLTLGVAAFPFSTAGQFLQIACRDDDGDTPREFDWPPFGTVTGDARPMLRRPFSLAGRRDTAAGVELDVILRTVGVGTTYLAGLRAGDGVNILGPLGRGFLPPPSGGLALMVGGGVGIPPMLYLAQQLALKSALDTAARPVRSVAFCGTTSRRLLPLTITADAPPPAADGVAPLYNVAEFAPHGTPAVITTDDGSYGYKGFVTDALAVYLDRWITDQADRVRSVIYACGPEPMLHRVAEIARRRQIACQVCVERVMACGLGTCQSCCVRVKKPDAAVPPMAGSDWCYRLACTDGPVFDAETLLW